MPPDATLEEFFWQHVVAERQQSAAVVDRERYLGVIRGTDLAGVPREQWATTPVDALTMRDIPVATLAWRIVDALRAMEAAGAEMIPVCDDGRFLGVVRADELLRLEEILEVLDPKG